MTDKSAIEVIELAKIGGKQIIEHGGEALLYGEVDSTEDIETDKGSSIAFHGMHRALLPDGSRLESPTLFFPGRAERIVAARWREHLSSAREGRFSYRVRVWIVSDDTTPTGYGWRYETWDPERRDRLAELEKGLDNVTLTDRSKASPKGSKAAPKVKF